MYLLKKAFQAFLCIELLHIAHSFDMLDDSEKDPVENTRITNLSIDIPSQVNGDQFDYENTFPNNFTVNYNKYDETFKIDFLKINESDPGYPIPHSNVYVIDKKTGKPAMHRLQANKEVNKNLKPYSLFYN